MENSAGSPDAPLLINLLKSVCELAQLFVIQARHKAPP